MTCAHGERFEIAVVPQARMGTAHTRNTRSYLLLQIADHRVNGWSPSGPKGQGYTQVHVQVDDGGGHKNELSPCRTRHAQNTKISSITSRTSLNEFHFIIITSSFCICSPSKEAKTSQMEMQPLSLLASWPLLLVLLLLPLACLLYLRQDHNKELFACS